jgi:predicted nucleotidyltransferase
MGRSRASTLLPVLRSEALARVAAAILLSDEPRHVRRIATETSLPYSTVQREIDRLEQAGLVRTTRTGVARIVTIDDRYPYLAEVRALLLKAYGPIAILGELLDGVEGVDEAYVFGSWARRYEGEWGPAPRDIDLLVVGSPSVDRIDDVAADAEHRLGQRVQPTVVSSAEWREPASGLIRTIKDGRLVRVQ